MNNTRFNIKEWQEKNLPKKEINEVSGFPIPGNIVKDIDKKHAMNAKLWKRATEDLIIALTKDMDYTGTEIEGYLRGYVNLMTKNLK